MCDYSLEAYKSRAAVDGEDLVIKAFPSGSKGFVEAKSNRRNTDFVLAQAFRDDPTSDCPVCCQSGVEMTLHLTGSYQTRSVAKGEPMDAHDEELQGEFSVTFHTLAKVENPWGGQTFGYRDGFVLPNGRYLSIQRLAPGTRATVTKALPLELTEAAKGGIDSVADIEVRVADLVNGTVPETEDVRLIP
jgi:hypothetical protein